MTDPIDDLARIRKLEDPAERALGLGRALESIPELQKQLRSERQAAVKELHDSGLTWVEIGERLGIHWARASQIARGMAGGSKKKAPPE